MILHCILGTVFLSSSLGSGSSQEYLSCWCRPRFVRRKSSEAKKSEWGTAYTAQHRENWLRGQPLSNFRDILEGLTLNSRFSSLQLLIVQTFRCIHPWVSVVLGIAPRLQAYQASTLPVGTHPQPLSSV